MNGVLGEYAEKFEVLCGRPGGGLQAIRGPLEEPAAAAARAHTCPAAGQRPPLVG